MIIEMQMKSYDLNIKLHWLSMIERKCSLRDTELLKMYLGNTLYCLVSGFE